VIVKPNLADAHRDGWLACWQVLRARPDTWALEGEESNPCRLDSDGQRRTQTDTADTA
jgi:hypothetical protein